MIKFGENDYFGDETSGTLRVGVSKDGSNTGNITAQVTPMTLSQFTALYGANPYTTNMDPAESECFSSQAQSRLYIYVVLKYKNRLTHGKLHSAVLDDKYFQLVRSL